MPSVVAIIPAHNEAPRIAAVTGPLLASRIFSRVLVVDDGSTDDTADAARRAGAEVLRLTPNRGKGGALYAGLQATTEPVVAFFDADLLGFTADHARSLVEPVVAGRCVMACGLRDYGTRYNTLQQALPPITGERAMRRDVLRGIPEDFWRGFRIEAAMNASARRLGETCLIPLTGLTIVPKWHKVGIRRGMRDAAAMSREVLEAMRDANRWYSAGMASPAIETLPNGAITGVDGMLDQIAGALARQAAPVVRQEIMPLILDDADMQQRVGEAAGRALADEWRPMAWVVAGSFAVLAISAGTAVAWSIYSSK